VVIEILGPPLGHGRCQSVPSCVASGCANASVVSLCTRRIVVRRWRGDRADARTLIAGSQAPLGRGSCTQKNASIPLSRHAQSLCPCSAPVATNAMVRPIKYRTVRLYEGGTHSPAAAAKEIAASNPPGSLIWFLAHASSDGRGPKSGSGRRAGNGSPPSPAHLKPPLSL
jgi:hypothetical protein